MELQTYNKSKLTVSDKLFGRSFNEGLVHQVITSYFAGSHKGTKAQKNRSDVRGGGAKPWRQKGTGRARAGTICSPLFRGGGVTHAEKPRQIVKKVNRKMYQGAIASILSELVRQDRLIIVDDIKLEAPKTKGILTELQKYGLNDGALIVVDEDDRNLSLAVRNLPYVDTCDAIHVDPVSLIGAGKVLMTVAAIKKLEENLS